MQDSFLDRVYGLSSPDETREFYDRWAATYDQEVLDSGYVTPLRCARALAAQIDSLDRPILDFGCGTGLSGGALVQTGFTVVDGADLSAEMLAQAREKGVYRDLWQVSPGADMPFEPGQYTAIVAAGVIGLGAAPAKTLDLLLDHLGPGGMLAFSYSDPTLSDREYERHLNDAFESGTARALFEEHGPHLPGAGMKATVYVVEKM